MGILVKTFCSGVKDSLIARAGTKGPMKQLFFPPLSIYITSLVGHEKLIIKYL
jgi:hypothetical protein